MLATTVAIAALTAPTVAAAAPRPLPDCLLVPRYGADIPPAPAPDDARAINRALDRLEGNRRGLILHWVDVYEPGADHDQMPVEPLLRDGRRLSLALIFGSADGDVDGYLAHVRESVRRYAGVLDSVQHRDRRTRSRSELLGNDRRGAGRLQTLGGLRRCQSLCRCLRPTGGTGWTARRRSSTIFNMKPAFHVYRDLIARLSADARASRNDRSNP